MPAGVGGVLSPITYWDDNHGSNYSFTFVWTSRLWYELTTRGSIWREIQTMGCGWGFLLSRKDFEWCGVSWSDNHWWCRE
jgi:hypothetical protein